MSQHRSGAGHVGGAAKLRSPEDIVFEGRRASAKDGKPRDLKFKGSKSSSSSSGGRGRVQKKRMQARAAKWKAGAGAGAGQQKGGAK